MLRIRFFIIVNGKGDIRFAKPRVWAQPALKQGEVPIQAHLELPKTLFTTPTLKATITIPESAVAPQEITADVLNSMGTALQAAGYIVKLTIDNPPAPSED